MHQQILEHFTENLAGEQDRRRTLISKTHISSTSVVDFDGYTTCLSACFVHRSPGVSCSASIFATRYTRCEACKAFHKYIGTAIRSVWKLANFRSAGLNRPSALALCTIFTKSLVSTFGNCMLTRPSLFKHMLSEIEELSRKSVVPQVQH